MACAAAIVSMRTSNRFTGASRPMATTRGSDDRSPPGANAGSTPGGTTCTLEGGNPSPKSSSRLDSAKVTTGVRRYSGGARRASRIRPADAAGPGSTWCHIGPCTWWSHVTRGLWNHSGLSHGTPFQISTSASRGPMRCSDSAAAVRAKTPYRPPRRTTR